jgi:hypothetical protein
MARTITTYNDVPCWVDIAQVHSLTAVTCTATDMAVAQGMLNAITGVDPGDLPEKLRSKDRRRLENMLCYQAPWVRGRVDIFQETDVTHVSQDGVSVDYPHQYATKLAPLANLIFQKLSWNRSGIEQGPPQGARYADAYAARDAVLRDEAVDTSGTGGYVRDFS